MKKLVLTVVLILAGTAAAQDSLNCREKGSWPFGPARVGGFDRAAENRPDFDPMDIVRRARGAAPDLPDRLSRNIGHQSGAPSPSTLSYGLSPDDGEFLIDSSYTPSRRDQHAPALVFDGTNYLVIWTDYSTNPSSIYGTRVTSKGSVLDKSGFAVCSMPSRNLHCPKLAYDGANTLVAYMALGLTGDIDIYGARLTPDGRMLDPSGIPISTSGVKESPSIAFGGTVYLVTWMDKRGGEWDIYGARVSPAGVVLDPNGIAIATGAQEQMRPAVAFDGHNFLVVWEDWLSGYADIYSARVSPAGIVLDPNGIAVATGAYKQIAPTVVLDIGDANRFD